MKLSTQISRFCLRFAARRFKVYRVLDIDEGVIVRSVIIEDLKRKQFFEVSYDEIGSGGDVRETDRANRDRITDLSDILSCISRITFDAWFYARMSLLKSGRSIEDALAAGLCQRRALWEQLTGSPGIAARTSPRASAKKSNLILTARMRSSIDETGQSSQNLIQQLTREITERLGTRKAYWQVIGKDEHGRELQTLTFEERH